LPNETLYLVQGTLDLLILRTLSGGAAHGYGISQSIRERTGGAIAVQDAALYQALRRLEDKGRIRAEWGLSDNNRRARYYELTSQGRRQLKDETTLWKRYAAAVFQVLDPAPGGTT
jgi:PadR family transcriptional regulator PadR